MTVLFLEFDKIELKRNQKLEIENELKPEENLVKKTCRELGITQKELAERLGVAPYTITRWAKGELDQIIQVLLTALVHQKRYFEVQSLLKTTNYL